MAQIIKKHEDKTIVFEKCFDLANGYGYHVTIYWQRFSHILNRYVSIGGTSYGFSKNKFSAYRKAVSNKKPLH